MYFEKVSMGIKNNMTFIHETHIKFSGCHPLILDSKFTFTLQLSGNDRQKKFCAFGISLRKKGNGERKNADQMKRL